MLLAPAFLLGLLAIGLPLWLHRFARETRERRPFASLMLIEESRIHRSRRHTLRYLLLLALRIALLVMLVLAFTEPVLPWRAPPLEKQGRTLHVIVLDTSLSMQQGGRWERAVARAREIVDSLGPGDQGLLVSADSRVRIVHGPVDQRAAEELRSALASLRPGLARLDYGMLMTSAPSWIGTRRLPTELHLITDLQQSASPLRFADLEPPPGVVLRIADVGEADTANARVTSVTRAPQDANAIEVRVNGARSSKPRDLVVAVDGRPRGRITVSLAESEDVRAVFPGIELGPGKHRVMVALEPADSLPQDDRYFVVLERREPRALIVGASNTGDDVAYFAAAVESLTHPRFAVERASTEAIAQRTLQDYSVLVVSDAGVLSGDALENIQSYVEGGGAVLMTLGPRSASLGTLPLSGHEAGRARSASDSAGRPQRVSSVDQSHPVLRDAQGWRSVRFLRHVPIEPRPGDTVLMRFEEGDPLLLDRRVGAGRLLVLTSPLDREWNDLAIHPLFVRFIGDAARYLTGDAAPVNATVGSMLATNAKGRAGAQVFDPRGRRVLTLDATAGSSRLLAEQLGFYEVRGGGRSDWIAVNVDPRESDLARMPEGSVDRWLKLQAAGRRGEAPDAGAVPGPTLKAIWPWLLLIAATLAFLEPLVANSYLHVRRGAPS